MWPMLLNMTRDECRRTLRRLELEAYSNMISVFRAQGALEDNRKKLLEELRAVLHISSDRHSAEARRVSNDELLATIAEQIAGPNTGLGWISEGRRRIPLMPRGVPQTMYTEIADKAAEAAAAENKEIRKRLETEKLIAPKTNEEEMPDSESQTAEAAHSNEATNDIELYPPIAMEDHSAKIWETELICRKRKIPEGGIISDETSTPVKNMRNIPLTSNQKHLNLSQVYSRFSQPSASKSSGHSKHSYNQVSKVSTSKSSHLHSGRGAPHKHRAHRQPKNPKQKKNQDMSLSPQMDYSGPPGSFQASYAQSLLGGKTKDIDDMKAKQQLSGVAADSPATVPHELAGADSAHPDDASAPSLPLPKHTPTPKSCQLVVKKRPDAASDKKIPMSEFKVLQKPSEEVKFVTSRQASNPSSTPKPLGASGKLVTTKIISSLPKSRPSTAPVVQSDKMIVVSKSSIDNRLTNSKIIITSSAIVTPNKDSIHTSTNSISNKTSEVLTPKGIPATDLKVSAKTFVLNPKSGQKMVVLPAKTNKDVQLPLFHFKGIPTAMKLVSVNSHLNTQTSKSPAITVVSKPAVVNTIPSSAKIVGVEPIKTANMADIVPVKGLIPPITSTKISNPIVRPINTKGNVIVVQKGATLGKTLTFAKNGNDVSKIIMGKNVNKLLQTSKTEQGDPTKSGNVIVLELNNEQTGRTTTMSEILGSRHNTPSTVQQKKSIEETQEITQETPVLFDNQIAPEICNTSSLDSTTSLQDMERLEDSSLGIIEKGNKEKSDFLKDSDGGKDSSSVTDWEMELDTVSGKSKDDVDKLNSLHLDLGMSSDSEGEFMVDGCKAKDHLQCACEKPHSETPPGEGAGALARTLLSQLQDEGSSSNDSSFAVRPRGRVDRADRSESEALSKARAKLSEKVAEARSQQKRIDVYSTALSEINLDSFSYLEEGMMAGDEDRLLTTTPTPTPAVSDTMPLHKNEQ